MFVHVVRMEREVNRTDEKITKMRGGDIIKQPGVVCNQLLR